MRHAITALVLIAVGVLPTQAAVILSTDLEGRTVAGSTASNIAWVTNGVADPGDLTAFDANPDGLFDTAAAQGRFAPDRNLHNEGSWSVDIPLAVLGSPIALTGVTLDAFIFNNSGALQTVGRDLDMSLALLDSLNNFIDSDQALNIYPGSGDIVQPQSVSFDLSGNLLSAGASYTLRLTASGSGQGNNAGFDNLSVEGVVRSNVSEPATLSMFLLGSLAIVLGFASRKRQASHLAA